MTQDFPKRRGRPKKLGDGPLSDADEFFQRFAAQPFSDRERLVNNGISNKYLIDLMVLLRIDAAFMEKYLYFEPGLLASMKEEDLFLPIVSDRIMALLELYVFGVELMGDFELFNEWMKRPSPNFVYHRPLDLLNTHSGLLEVRGVLNEIKHGHY
ncbi:antitoxin Xre/MbcA/ParS toxin-binding domain-containing protein [Chitinophaga lutea]